MTAIAHPTMRDLLQAGAHFGHKTKDWNPKMAPYIYGERSGIHIIDLEQTKTALEHALLFVQHLARDPNAQILFVGTKWSASRIIVEQANRCKMPYVDHRWLGGMLTNYKTVKQSVKRMKKLEDMQSSGVFSKLTKKESLQITRQLSKLKASIGGISHLAGLPDALFVIDVHHESLAVTEANRLRIPVIGIVDTNSNIENISYPIPANDDASRAVKLFCQVVADVILSEREDHQVSQRQQSVEKTLQAKHDSSQPPEEAISETDQSASQ